MGGNLQNVATWTSNSLWSTLRATHLCSKSEPVGLPEKKWLALILSKNNTIPFKPYCPAKGCQQVCAMAYLILLYFCMYENELKLIVINDIRHWPLT